MIELSEDTSMLVDALYKNDEQNRHMKERLIKECSENIPFCENNNPKQMERIRFSVLKLFSEKGDSIILK